jgi:hypothetical protein
MNNFVFADTKNSLTNYCVYNIEVIIAKLISYNIFLYIYIYIYIYVLEYIV